MKEITMTIAKHSGLYFINCETLNLTASGETLMSAVQDLAVDLGNVYRMIRDAPDAELTHDAQELKKTLKEWT